MANLKDFFTRKASLVWNGASSIEDLRRIGNGKIPEDITKEEFEQLKAGIAEILRKKVVELMDTSSDSFATCMAYGQGKHTYDQLLKNLKRWHSETECYNKIKSLRDFCVQMGFYTGEERVSVFGERTDEDGDIRDGMKLGIERWFREKNIVEELLDLIEKTFREIFPGTSINTRNLFNIPQAISDAVRDCADGDMIYIYNLGDTMRKILSDDYDYCYYKRAPRHNPETVVEKEGFKVPLSERRIGRVEHTLYSVDDIVYKVSCNEDAVIRGLDLFNDADNERYRRSCDKVMEHIKTRIIESVDRFLSELTPYNLITEI